MCARARVDDTYVVNFEEYFGSFVSYRMIGIVFLFFVFFECVLKNV